MHFTWEEAASTWEVLISAVKLTSAANQALVPENYWCVINMSVTGFLCKILVNIIVYCVLTRAFDSVVQLIYVGVIHENFARLHVHALKSVTS